MSYAFHHVHLMATDPDRTAGWYVSLFNFQIVSDTVTVLGNRLIRCRTTDGALINVSDARAGGKLEKGPTAAHEGVDHFGLSVDDLDAELARLTSQGVRVLEGPIELAGGVRFAFVAAPDDARLELVQAGV